MPLARRQIRPAPRTHLCQLDHDWPAIDAAMEAAGWLKRTDNGKPDTVDGETTHAEDTAPAQGTPTRRLLGISQQRGDTTRREGED